MPGQSDWERTPTVIVAIYAAIVATYAAIISTAVAILQFMSYRRDRPRLKVSYLKNREMVGDPNYHGISLTIVTAVNAGRRPTTVEGIGAFYLKGGGAVFMDTRPHLPCELNEGRSVTLVDDAGIDFDRIANFGAWSSAGKSAYVPVASRVRRCAWAVYRVIKGKK